MVVWPLLQGRRIDGAPTLRIPLCAGECPSPLTSANTRLTEPRETGVHDPMTQPRRREPTTRTDPITYTAQPLHPIHHTAPATRFAPSGGPAPSPADLAVT